MAKQFDGVVGRTFAESRASWPPKEQAPAGAPNIVMVLLDDVGYAQFGCYGADIATPTFDRLAASGLRYANFHTTALCSPTRACLMTGRNHHASGMARIVEFSSGFPGYDATIPAENGFLSEILVRNGYATFALGKWHLTPATEMTLGGPRHHWPLSKGFERYYGFLAGETDQYHPDLIHDNHQVLPPCSPDDGYHLTEDLADRAIAYIKDLRAYRADKPFLLYFAPGACHAPHQAPAQFIEPYRGRFDLGWDAWRDQVYARQLKSGLLPAGTELSARPSWVPAWDTLSVDERRLYARMMEVYAGFLTHTDAQVGRVIEFIERLGEFDNTIVLIMSDNGASAEGGPRGSFNEQYFFNFVPESLEENLRRIDDLGTPRANNHYPWGWAWAGNTPLKRFKRDTHEGGVCDPLIVHWPARLGRPGETRQQYVHAIDVTPTLLELIGMAAPREIAGVAQTPFDGTSFAHTLSGGDEPSRHLMQYYEMLGSRALYHDGWKAVVFHPPAMMAYDGSDATRSFDDDIWELYHVAEDFSECHDVAAQHPDKLAELQALWWKEAERNQVLPLNNQPGRFGDTRFRRERYTFFPGISSIPETMAPNLRNRPFQLFASLRVPAQGDCDGVIIGHGGHCGGYALYLAGRRLHYVNNLLGAQLTTISASVELPVGDVLARATFTPTGRFAGDLELWYGDVPVGRGHIPHTTPISYGVDPFAVGYQRMTPIAPALRGTAAITPGVLDHVVVEVTGKAYRDPAREDRARLATQ
ncbi:MAG: arylsulfatase [Deltaproteobacteria bacterium]|nr:arylsulfatase [Deltaproteobacteria bacterium]MBI3389328.1 arylsulfatase [Deltaproteobacteria bacterium]